MRPKNERIAIQAIAEGEPSLVLGARGTEMIEVLLESGFRLGSALGSGLKLGSGP